MDKDRGRNVAEHLENLPPIWSGGAQDARSRMLAARIKDKLALKLSLPPDRHEWWELWKKFVIRRRKKSVNVNVNVSEEDTTASAGGASVGMGESSEGGEGDEDNEEGSGDSGLVGGGKVVPGAAGVSLQAFDILTDFQGKILRTLHRSAERSERHFIDFLRVVREEKADMAKHYERNLEVITKGAGATNQAMQQAIFNLTASLDKMMKAKADISLRADKMTARYFKKLRKLEKLLSEAKPENEVHIVQEILGYIEPFLPVIKPFWGVISAKIAEKLQAVAA